MKNIGICFYGQQHDKISRNFYKKTKWDRFIPSLAFILTGSISKYEEKANVRRKKGSKGKTDLDEFIVLIQKHQENDYTNFYKNITKIAENNKIKIPKIQSELLELKDRFDPNYCYKVVGNFFKNRFKDMYTENVKVYFNINTGTHAVQFSVYLLAHRNVVPIKIVQTFPNTKGRNPLKSSIKELPLDWTELPELNKDLIRKRDSAYVRVVPADIPDKEYKKKWKNFINIACETKDHLLILGNTGTGKSTLAENIHNEWIKNKSDNDEKERPFVPVNCAGFSVELIESELFGHIKGAFTGADKEKKGAIEEANKGTLFLDEVGELDIRVQAKLLTVIESKEYYRVGELGGQKRKQECRLIFATNQNILKMISENKFRSDLYSRISSWKIEMEQLKELYPALDNKITKILSKWCDEGFEDKKVHVEFDSGAKNRYIDFAKSDEAKWTGNFRDLSQSINRMATLVSVNNKGAGGIIKNKYVDDEIKMLKSLWKPKFEEPEYDGNLEPLLYKLITHSFKNKYPDLPLIFAVEKFLQDQSLYFEKNKADAARLLYEGKDKLNNASSRFNERKKAVETK